jgi:hypothetical protein
MIQEKSIKKRRTQAPDITKEKILVLSISKIILPMIREHIEITLSMRG